MSTFRLFRLYHKYLKVETLKRCADIRLVHEIDEERRHFSAFPKELSHIINRRFRYQCPSVTGARVNQCFNRFNTGLFYRTKYVNK